MSALLVMMGSARLLQSSAKEDMMTPHIAEPS
jgi:hypothetical protein